MARRKRKKVRPAERVASGIILACLASVGLLVYLTGRAGASPDAQDFAQGVQLAPPEVGSLALSGTRTFDPENLYEYINGQAPHYIGFGFRALQVAEYSSEENAIPSLVVDIYDMGQRRNAYGLFTSSFPPEEEPAELGNAGYQSGNVAVFWKGDYYIRVAALTGNDLAGQVDEAARAVADLIQDESRVLREFSAFPDEGLIPETLAFSKSAAFGLPYLRETFVAAYERDGVYYRLFFADLGDPDEALQVLKEHGEFLKSGGGLKESDLQGTDTLVWGEDRYVGPTLLVASGHIVAGSTGLPELNQAEAAVTRLLNEAVRVLAEGEGDSLGTD